MQFQDYFELLKKQLIQAGDELVGLNVLHETLGDGVVSKVEKRESQKSLIDIKFSDGKKATFNEISEDFFQIPSQKEQVIASIIEFLKNNCNEILEVQKKQQKLQEKLDGILAQITFKYEVLYEKLKHYNIANFYKTLAEQPFQTEAITGEDKKIALDISAPLMHTEAAINIATEVHNEFLLIAEILQKIDLSLDLEPNEIEGLSKKKLFNLLATASYRSYKKNNDLWTLVQACKFLRKAKMSERVIEITQDFAKGSLPQTHSRIFAAIYTTRGAAFKDLSDFENAKEMANLALVSEESKYSHNLMGAICYWGQEFSKGDAHFQRASELGSAFGDRISEIRMASHKLDAEGKRKLMEHLASINLKI
jgi:hypothetical protein